MRLLISVRLSQSLPKCVKFLRVIYEIWILGKVSLKKVSEFVFNVSPTAKVMWRQGHHLRVSSDRMEEQGIKLWTPGFKASGLSTTLRWLLVSLKTLN